MDSPLTELDGSEKTLDAPKQEDEKEKEGSMRDYARVFAYADRLGWALYTTAFLGSIASGATLPLMTLVFGSFTTKFNNFSTGQSSPDQFRSDVDHFILWFIYLFVARFIIAYIANVCITVAAIRTVRALRQAFLESTLRQEVWHFDKKTNGAAATQVTTNGNRINQGIAEKLGFVVQALSLFFSSFIIALAKQWKLSLITMSIIPAIFLITGACIAVDAVQEARIVRIYSRAAVLAQEAISSIRTVHAFWAQDKMAEGYNRYLEEAHKEGKKKSPNYGILFSTENFCVYSGIALSFWKGFRMYQSGEISDVGTVFTVVLAVTIAATAISTIAPQIQSLTNAASAASELFSIIDKESLLDPLSTEGRSPHTCQGDIVIKNLDFAYPARPTAQVLHGLSLSIPAGKTTALVGASGCGKSTLVGLLERWYKPPSGEILLDGTDISEYNTKWLRSNIRLVQQEPILFRGTIYDNVCKGLIGDQLELPVEKQRALVEEACKASNAHEFITDLPQGYDTEVGERASMLSGGQRQRVAIARSIISDPKVLLLDEATSALDPRAERIVQDALDRVSKNRTTLVIAHKLATVKNADNIVVMSYGKVLEQGSHQELMSGDGHYAALVRAQDLGGDAEEADASEKPGALARTISMQRTKPDAQSITSDAEAQKLSSGTLGYSLLRCIIIMFYEQKSLYWCFAISSVGCLMGGATFPAQAILFSRLIHIFTLTGSEARDQADFYALMFFVVAIGNFVAYFTIGWLCNVIGQTVTHRYRLEMFKHVLAQDMDFFDRPENSSGALTSKLSSLPNALQELISANILLIFIVCVNIVSCSILAIVEGWKLGLVIVFGGLPPLLTAGYARIRLDQKLERETSERFADSAGLATEAVTSIRTVASLTLESRILAEYGDCLDGIVLRSVRSLLWTMLWFALSQSLEFLIMALGFWYGSRLLANGEYTATQFYVIFIAVIFGGQAAAQFFGYSTSLTKAKPAANYILWLRTLKPIIAEKPENKDIGPDDPPTANSPSDPEKSKEGNIDVNDVEFRYRQRDASRVLRGITVPIPKSSYIAFVGPSGCGKSTLISLLERFYDPTSGSITLSTRNIATMSPRRYRNYMSLVQQEPTLYQGSVRENIALGLQDDPPDTQILEALRQANALEFVQSLPDGLATPCGSKGLQFSGGQRQRIAIARALIRKPRLLLLDEATSALDTQSERIVQATLDEAASTRTTIAVAHRLSTIKNADRIFVFAGGKVVESGNHAELQKLRGRYWQMCLAQSLDRA